MTPQLEIPSFNTRKTNVQDILSSFSVDTLPSEYKPELFRSINESQGQSELTISADLEGSLMQWATHDEEAYRLLNRIQPERTRSILFHQKVARRLDAEFESYSEIDRGSSAMSIREEVREISNNLRTIVEASTERQKMENRAFRLNSFIEVLRKICENSLDISGSGRRTRRSSGSQTEVSLFHMTVVDPESEQDHFMLELLDWMADYFVEALTPYRNNLEYIASQLETLSAPASYQRSFQEILDKVIAATTGGEQASTTSAPPPPPSSGPRSSGKKRPAGEAKGGKAGKRRVGT